MSIARRRRCRRTVRASAVIGCVRVCSCQRPRRGGSMPVSRCGTAERAVARGGPTRDGDPPARSTSPSHKRRAALALGQLLEFCLRLNEAALSTDSFRRDRTQSIPIGYGHTANNRGRADLRVWRTNSFHAVWRATIRLAGQDARQRCPEWSEHRVTLARADLPDEPGRIAHEVRSSWCVPGPDSF